MKLALVAPAGTVTLAGTLAAPGWLLDSETTVPPAGATLDSVTVPVDGFPPVTLVGFTVNAESVEDGGGVPAGLTVSVAERVTPPPVTEIVTGVETLTMLVKMSNPPVVMPVGIMTLLLTRAVAGLLLLTSKVSSYVAGDATVTVANEPS